MKPKIKKVYFAHAMDLIDPQEIKKNINKFEKLIKKYGNVELINTYTISSSLKRSELNPIEKAKFVVTRDLELLKESNVLFVDYSRQNMNYIGCTCEIVYAFIYNKPIIVYVGNSGNENRLWLLYHTDKIYKNLKDALEELSKFI